MDCEAVVGFLGQVPLMQRLPGSSLRKIAEVVQLKHYDFGEYVVREGETGEGLYFILEGQNPVMSPSSPEESKTEGCSKMKVATPFVPSRDLVSLTSGIVCSSVHIQELTPFRVRFGRASCKDRH